MKKIYRKLTAVAMIYALAVVALPVNARSTEAEPEEYSSETGRDDIALIISSTPNADESAAKNFFEANIGSNVFTPAEALANNIIYTYTSKDEDGNEQTGSFKGNLFSIGFQRDVEDENGVGGYRAIREPLKYKVIWIYIDQAARKGVGNLPAEFSDSKFINELRNYMLQGGNVLLSGFATQLVTELGRVPSKYAPNAFEQDYNHNTDGRLWGINTKFGGLDNSNCILFSGLTRDLSDNWGEGENLSSDDYRTFGMYANNNNMIANNNMVWDFSSIFGNVENANLTTFQEDTHSKVLATWGQMHDATHAGLIEFLPFYTPLWNCYTGTVICNGLAACQFNNNDSEVGLANLKKLFTNTLCHLAGDEDYAPNEPQYNAKLLETLANEQNYVLESTGRIALFVPYTPAEDGRINWVNTREENVYNWFKSNYCSEGSCGEILFGNEIEKIDSNKFDCVWVNIDSDVKINNIEDLYNNVLHVERSFIESLGAKLKEYALDGGNIYVTNDAVWLATLTKHAKDNPSSDYDKNESTGTDTWGYTFKHDDCTNSHNNLACDGYAANHVIFRNMPTMNGRDYAVSLISYNGTIRDHNQAWKLNNHDNLPTFNNENNCHVLGVWSNEQFYNGQHAACLVEFHSLKNRAQENAPRRAEAESDEDVYTTLKAMQDRQGSMIANGGSAYLWDNNQDISGVKKLTENILAYLSPVMRETGVVETGVGEIVDNAEVDAAPVYFTLQGARVATPEKGIYIVVCNGRAKKVIF